MYHADLIGGLIASVATRVPVVWNLRQSTLDSNTSKKATIRIARLCAGISNRLPHAIICGSHAAYESHVRFGYRPDRMVVLPNGFDTETYVPDRQSRFELLRELGIGDGPFVVGLVARFDPQKDHGTFFAAAAALVRCVPHVRFVLYGEGIDEHNPALRALVDSHGLGGRTHLLGVRDGLASFYPALDVLALSSAYGEGAPNVIGEAMSCGVPCVTTDIGDSAAIVGPAGVVVSCRDSNALAAALFRIAGMRADQRRQLGKKARARIADEYPIGVMIGRYEDLYRRIYSQRYSCCGISVPSAAGW
jgi:glycosyltransferase involved in cell wall biosynthesis